MDDKHPQAITCTLGGQTKRIKLSPSAFRIAQRKHGVDIKVSEIGASFSFATLALFVWIGLLPDEPDLDEDRVLEWLAASDNEAEIYERVGTALASLVESIEAFTKAMSPPKGKKK